MEHVRIIVGGYLGLLRAGGVTWDYVQYPVGLAAMGHDVFYVEDTRLWPIYQTDNDGTDCMANVQQLARIMREFGLGDRWAYRDEVSRRCFGMSLEAVQDACDSADLLINISCSTWMRDEYRRIPVRILIDTDPMFTQIQHASETMFTPGTSSMRELIHAHTHHFTFGENVGVADCRIPTCGIDWRPTRQPIVLGLWPMRDLPLSPDAAWTTLMNWTAAPPLTWASETWGQKNITFQQVLELPTRVADVPLAIAVGQTTGEPFPAADARKNGWRVLDPNLVAPNWDAYRSFIYGSLGEFGVAKETYVKACTGWFSCRSACYLAAGRPVIAQDTGWSRFLPHHRGLLPFHDEASAVAALNEIMADLRPHAHAAREIAQEFFNSERVLNQMLEQVGG